METATLLLWRLFCSVAVLTFAECKFCWHIFHGQAKYFHCDINQRCCGTRCCDNIVAFYRLWYFWMCVLMLFVSCCGGGFWLRRRGMTDEMHASLTGETDEGFVRRVIPTGGNSRAPIPDPFYPSVENEGGSQPVLPPAYSDVAESKPPSYDSIFQEGDQQGGDNPSFEEDSHLPTGPSIQNSINQEEDKNNSPTISIQK